MIIYVYDINTLNLIAKPQVKDYETFKKNPIGFYPEWDVQNHLASEVEFQNPIIIDNLIREKSREELILLDNKIELLVDGKYIENNKIIVVEAPDHLFKKVWNRESKEWQEGVTQEEIDKEIKRLIDEFIELSEQKEKYIKYGFETLEIEKKIEENILKRNYLSSLQIKETKNLE